MVEHEKFMQQAIKLAEKGRGYVHPNPLVGAVVVKDGKVIAKGYHKAFGRDHAEVEALKKIDPKTKIDLYVTLEPCAHYGKTPPCLDMLLKYNLGKVVIGHRDPNPQVNGKSIRQLSKHGFEVITNVCSHEIHKQNEVYFHFMKTKRPFVTLKAAITLDGKIATETGESKWITSVNSRKLAHKLRTENDAILVGIGTVVADDPLLIPRSANGVRFKPPTRVIIDPSLRIPMDSKIIKTSKLYPTIIVCGRLSDKAKEQQLEKQSVKIIHLPEKKGRFTFADLLDNLGSRSISSLMIEGGSVINSLAWREKLVNKIVFFTAPKIFGGDKLPVIGGVGVSDLSDAISLKITKVEYLNPDILVEADVR